MDAPGRLREVKRPEEIEALFTHIVTRLAPEYRRNMLLLDALFRSLSQKPGLPYLPRLQVCRESLRDCLNLADSIIGSAGIMAGNEDPGERLPSLASVLLQITRRLSSIIGDALVVVSVLSIARSLETSNGLFERFVELFAGSKEGAQGIPDGLFPLPPSLQEQLGSEGLTLSSLVALSAGSITASMDEKAGRLMDAMKGAAEGLPGAELVDFSKALDFFAPLVDRVVNYVSERLRRTEHIQEPARVAGEFHELTAHMAGLLIGCQEMESAFEQGDSRRFLDSLLCALQWYSAAAGETLGLFSTDDREDMLGTLESHGKMLKSVSTYLSPCAFHGALALLIPLCCSVSLLGMVEGGEPHA
jgi:hypothetical protein